MKITDTFILPVRNLFRRKIRSWLTMLGIIIGIAAVVSLISLSQGMREAILGQFNDLGTDKLTIQAKSLQFGPPGSGAARPLTDRDFREVKNVQGVVQGATRIIKPLKFEFDGQVKFEFAASIPDDEKERNFVYDAGKLSAESGRMLKSGEYKKIVMGNSLKSDYRLGDKIKIDGSTYDIVGFLIKKGNPFQDSAILMPERALKEIYNIKDEVSIIVVQVAKDQDINVVQDRIERALRRLRDVKEGKEDFQVQSPQQLLGTFNTILDVVQAVIIGIAAISLLVGGIGIMNTMYTAVLERIKEIGIMKAIGARNSDVLAIFLIESGLLGIVGGGIGIVIGIAFSKIVEFGATQYFGSTILKAQITLTLVLGALAFSFVVGTIAGFLPARQAAHLKPVDALRRE